MENVAPRASSPWVGLSWLLAGALLLCEYLFISFIFDARAWVMVEGPLSVLGHLGELATMATVAVFGTFLLRGNAILEELRAQHRPQPLSRRALWAVLHAVGYVLLIVATSRIFSVADPARVTALGLAAWAAAAVLSVLSLLLVILPWSSLRALAPRVAPAIAIGGLAGAAAFGFGQLSSLLWGPMGRLTLVSVYALLRQLADDVQVDYETFTIGTPAFIVEVAPVCSGFEGIGLIIVFLGGYIALNRKELRFPNALWLLPLAVLTVWSANVVRIVALILIGASGSPQVALGGFHSKAGWVFFCFVALGFAAWLRSSDTFSIRPAERASHGAMESARSAAAAYLLPQLVLLATMLITGLFVHVVDWLYGLRILAALIVVWAMRATLRPLVVKPGWEAYAIGVVVFALWYPLTEHYTPGGQELKTTVLSAGQPWAALWIAVRALGSVLVVPLVEELAFRGFLLRRIISADFESVPFHKLTLPALLISSIAFGMMHGDKIAGTLAGVAYALAQWRRGQVMDAVVAHAVTNALVVADVLVLGAWAQW